MKGGSFRQEHEHRLDALAATQTQQIAQRMVRIGRHMKLRQAQLVVAARRFQRSLASFRSDRITCEGNPAGLVDAGPPIQTSFIAEPTGRHITHDCKAMTVTWQQGGFYPVGQGKSFDGIAFDQAYFLQA